MHSHKQGLVVRGWRGLVGLVMISLLFLCCLLVVVVNSMFCIVVLLLVGMLFLL